MSFSGRADLETTPGSGRVDMPGSGIENHMSFFRCTTCIVHCVSGLDISSVDITPLGISSPVISSPDTRTPQKGRTGESGKIRVCSKFKDAVGLEFALSLRTMRG